MSASVEEPELDGLALDELLEDGLDEDDGGVLVEPAPAAPPLVLELGEELDEAPPLAGLFDASLELEELDGEEELAPGVVEPEEDALPEGELDGDDVVPLDDEDEEPEGDVVEPEGEVDEELEPPRSHAVISDAPSARETATARVESLMWPPWLGYEMRGARIGPSA